MSSDPSSAVPGASEKEVTDNATGLPSPKSEADPDQAREESRKPLDDGSHDTIDDPDVPIASVEAPDPDHEADARSDSKSTSNGSMSDDSDSEISDMYDMFRPSESPAESVLDMMDRMDRRMKRMREPQPLRYAKEITHEKIDGHGTFMKFLCDRLAYLEHEVEILRGGRPAEQELSPSPSVIAPTVPKTRRFPITEYGNYQWFNRRNGPSPNRRVDFVLEVQLVRDDAGIQAWPAPGVAQDPTSGSDHGNEQIVESAHGVMVGDLIPHRVRICSPLLSTCIREICKEFIPSTNLVFITPFKLFVRHEKDIRQALDKAEAQFQRLYKNKEPRKSRKDPGTETGQSRRSSPVSDMNDEPMESGHSRITHGRPENESGESSEESSDEGELDEVSKEEIREKFEHLRLLVQLFDGPLKPVFDLYHSIKDGSATRIPFEYLWYLFEHGQEVVKQGGDLQLARVLRFTGGREARIPSIPPPPPHLRVGPPIPPSVDPPPTVTNSFAVDCYRWEFDGEKFGVLNNVYWIRPYKGWRDITSLSVYPFSFNKNSNKFKKQLEDRGEKFLSLSKRNEASHRHYTGLTLESNTTSAEEVRIPSQASLCHF